MREQPAPPPDPRALSLPSAAITPTEEPAPGRDGSPSYINCSLAGPGPVPASAPASPQYENVGPGESPGYVPPGAVFQLPARPDPDPAAQEDRVSQSEGEREEEVAATVNYIVLDLEKPAEQAGPGQHELQLEPAAAAAGRYVTIDFDKTDALIKSANQRRVEVLEKNYNNPFVGFLRTRPLGRGRPVIIPACRTSTHSQGYIENLQ